MNMKMAVYGGMLMYYCAKVAALFLVKDDSLE